MLRDLSLQREQDFQQALTLAPESLRDFLEAYKNKDRKLTKDRLNVIMLSPSLLRREKLAIQLVSADLFAELVETWRRYPAELMLTARDFGVAGCEEAIGLARQLGHQACEAVYLGLQACGFSEAGSQRAAGEKLQEALEIRRRLAESEPGVYRPDVALTLNNLGGVLSHLNEKQAARDKLEEALETYRKLAKSEPGVYRPDVALTLNNLGFVLSQLNEKRAAHDKLEEALEIRRKLAESEPGVYQPYLAETLNNLGNVLSQLNEKRAAHDKLEEALEIRRKLAESEPGVYQPYLAETLNNLGSVLSDLNEKRAAREEYEEALEIRRKLAESEPGVNRPNLAMTLNNLGTLLSELNEKRTAREKLEEALQTYRELAKSEPNVYQPDAAWTLNSLGTLLSELNEKRAAREKYEEAARIHLSFGPSLESARLNASFAHLEADEGGEFCDRALELSVAAVNALEGLLSSLHASEHTDRHAFKRYIEPAYLRLIRFHSTSDRRADISQLPPLLEALRRPELLSTADPAIVTRSASWQDVVSNTCAVAEWMDKQFAVFVWIQVAGSEMIFSILEPGRPLHVEKADQSCIDAFRFLRNESWKYFEDPASVEQACNQIDGLAAQCVDFLPGAIRDLLFDATCRTIILAPCGESSLFPWESLHLDGDYFALRKVVARTHGLGELEQVLQRQPETPSAVIVGNPRHEGAPDLPAAGAEACALWNRLRARGWKVRGGVRAPGNLLLGEEATTNNVVEWLRNEASGLIVFSSHGEPMSVLLEGKDKLTDATVVSVGLKHHPLLHFDCCWAGWNVGSGGGRYLGMPVAALRAGASAAIASAHPLYDKHAAHFAEVLYTCLLNHGLCLGDALLEARKALKSNPLHWATTVLWGNPQVRLRR